MVWGHSAARQGWLLARAGQWRAGSTWGVPNSVLLLLVFVGALTCLVPSLGHTGTGTRRWHLPGTRVTEHWCYPPIDVFRVRVPASLCAPFAPSLLWGLHPLLGFPCIPGKMQQHPPAASGPRHEGAWPGAAAVGCWKEKGSGGAFPILHIKGRMKQDLALTEVFVLMRCPSRGTWKCRPGLIFWSLFRKWSNNGS